MIDMSVSQQPFLKKFPFASINMMSKHFELARGTITEIFQQNLGFQTFSRRWVYNQLTPT
jgi:hypothetical protein